MKKRQEVLVTVEEKIKMVIIELYETTYDMYPYDIGAGGGGGVNRKRISYFIVQEIPDLISHHKC